MTTSLREVSFAWLPLSLILIGYGAAQLINRELSTNVQDGARNSLGFELHIIEPAIADTWMFGQLPTTWLQQCGQLATGPHWYDAIAAVVYISHFLVIPGVAAVLWFRNRSRFLDWIGCVLLLVGIGIAVYITYPMAPPWLAARLGVIDTVQRISGIGWGYLHLDLLDSLLGQSQTASNPVAAMPSLHAASAALVAMFFWRATSWAVRVVLIIYPLLMAVTLVYTGEHYVIDVLVGWLAAGLAVTGCAALRRFAPKSIGANRNLSR